MNTLNLIKKQINKASALHDAQITHTAYRGIVTKVTNVNQLKCMVSSHTVDTPTLSD